MTDLISGAALLAARAAFGGTYDEFARRVPALIPRRAR